MKSIECFTALLEYTSEEAWQKAIFNLGKAYGFERTLIAVAPERPASLGDVFLLSNYSDQWRGNYDTKQLIGIDPTVAHCATRSTPLIWEPALFASPRQKEMYEEASHYGLSSGITLPYHGVNGEIGLLCFANNDKPGKRVQRDALHALPALSLMRDFAFETFLRFAKRADHGPPPAPALTQCEFECLKWCAAGKSSWEISKILCCSESAVNFHFETLRHKFQVATRRQAVVKAVHCGLLLPG